jgi:8-oxo-dGTP pyrophosphatase MutT (NUDIX family)
VIPSAVLVPLFRDEEGELRILLVQRGAGGIHGGQLGLPGGKREPGDASLLETALREAEEEIGLERSTVEVVATLDPLDLLVSGFRVHPYLARITPRGEWQLAEGEIEGVLTPALRDLVDPSRRIERDLDFATRPALRQVEGIALEDGSFLWGFTLRLLDRLLPRVLAGEWAF